MVAGTLGAYAIAALVAAALARTLPMPRIEAQVPATLLGIAIAPAVTIWAFLARGPARAWAGVALAAAGLVALVWAAGPHA